MAAVYTTTIPKNTRNGLAFVKLTVIVYGTKTNKKLARASEFRF